MSSLQKMLAVLDLFGADDVLLGADGIAERLGYAQTTAYRYIATLCEAGLLARFNDEYALGPRIVELDLHIRRNDPLLRCARPVMADLARRLGFDAILLTLYGDRIVTAHHERGGDPALVSYSRGHRMPLFAGAGSKAIVANLPSARRRRLLGRLDPAPPGGIDALLRAARAVQRDGYAISLGELDPGNIGVAAPVVATAVTLPAALAIVMTEQRFAIADRAMTIAVVREGAARISTALSAEAAGLAR